MPPFIGGIFYLFYNTQVNLKIFNFSAVKNVKHLNINLLSLC